MDFQIMNYVVEVEIYTYIILSPIFFVLALFTLVYYIRRRYKLYKEINRIPKDMLILEGYKNYLKNLKLKCIINNFIIVILLIEIAQNVCQFLAYFPAKIIVFLEECPLYLKLQHYSILLYPTIRYSLVPVLSMMMGFLWLAYRKYEYKYTIIRWTWYIVIRALVLFIIQYSSITKLIPLDYQTSYDLFTTILLLILPSIDFIQFVYYARRFYLHLKSREKEIRLFYFDMEAYLDSKYLRIHFKIATILVGTALFFYTLAIYSILLNIFDDIPFYLLYIPGYQQLYYILIISDSIITYTTSFSYLICKVLFMLNYLYIFIVVAYKSYRDRKKLENINDYIRPIVKKYHDNYYNNRYTNYA